MNSDPMQCIRSRSRQEWADHFLGRWGDVRRWLNANGERALFVGIVLGLLAAVAFPVMLAIIAFFAVVGGLVWFLAEPAPADPFPVEPLRTQSDVVEPVAADPLGTIGDTPPSARPTASEATAEEVVDAQPKVREERYANWDEPRQGTQQADKPDSMEPH